MQLLSSQSREVLESPRTFTVLILIVGLCMLAYSVIFQQWVITAGVCAFPFIILLFIYSVQYPVASFIVYATAAYFFGAIDRYLRIEGISIILDATLLYTLVASLLNKIFNENSAIHFRNMANALIIGYLAWMLFIVIQLTNQGTDLSKILTSSRSWLLGTPILYLLSSLLLNSPKKLRYALILLGGFTIIVFLKLLWQKYRWFDAAEAAWLMEGSWRTHLLASGIRYFSLFSDAGNFGAIMGMTTIIYFIQFLHPYTRKLRYFYLLIAIMGGAGMLMSGTRGSIIVPLGGLALYCLISKNIKMMAYSAITGIMIFCFFSYTDIGNSNAMIRRMRTAFQPTEDASFNVRLENQKKIAEYLKKYPMGAGIGGTVITTLWEGDKYQDYSVPPDSFYVDIWTQCGTYGLVLYIAIFVCIIMRSCYIIMFRIKDPPLRNALAALLCGMFGLFLNGYVGRGMGFQPGVSLIGFFFAFILNGPYIEQQISKHTNNKL